MTPEEVLAKRHWGTDICQAPRCSARAVYLVMESRPQDADADEWWQYCCRKHALQFAEQHGLELPGSTVSHNRHH